MLHHLTHHLSLIILLGLLSHGLPPAALSIPRTSHTLIDSPSIDSPTKRVALPADDLHLPSLSMDLDVAPNLVTIGDTVVFTLTVSNAAPDPAIDLLITLPTPEGALALPSPHTIRPKEGWQWPLGRLDGRNSTYVTGQLHLLRQPAGDALLLHAQATARGLDLPIHEDGGVLVANHTLDAATARFLPGSTSRLRSTDGNVQIDTPTRLFGRALTLRHATTPLAEVMPPPSASFRRGLGIFFLDATDDQGIAVHQLTTPLTITVRYTPEQLAALDIAEGDLTLTWYNHDAQIWQAIPTSIDPATQTVSAVVNHFSPFQLSDGSSPSKAFIPSLQGFQVSAFTGAASYSYPIELPAGPGGPTPQLALSYSSASADGVGGLRLKQQAGWVGQGWSLDTGSVAVQKLPNGEAVYTMVVDGQSYDLVRGAALVGSPSLSDPTHWDWRPTDESFIRVRVIGNGVSTSTRGGFSFGTPNPRYTWQLWSKDGTRYDFSDDMWWGWHYCGSTGDYAYMEANRWLLTTVTDTHDNTINYTYGRDSQAKGETCFHVQGTVDRDIWPTAISWAGGRYQVNLVSSARANDTQYEGADNQYGGINGQPRQTRRLDAIQVWSKPASTWQLVRQYNLGYDYSLRSDALLGTGCPSGQVKCPDNNYPRLTLKSIQRVGNDGSTALPATTFSYGAFSAPLANGRYWAGGAWNRLTTITNGQGGTVTLAYENVGQAANSPLMDNQRRITTRTQTDGRGNSYSWSYGYGTPAVNSLGTTRGPASPWGYGSYGTQAYPNSAVLYYNAFADVLHNNRNWLTHQPMREFRGHDWVQETDPSGTHTKHFFHQGAAVDLCTPMATGGGIGADACFQRLRNGEFLKGKEYRTQILPVSGSTPLQETITNFAVQFLDYTSTPLTGQWRAFSYPYQVDQNQYENQNTPLLRRTRTFYNPDCTVDTPITVVTAYGNVGCVQEYLGSTLLRSSQTQYVTRNNSGGYIVDRTSQEVISDGAGQRLAIRNIFYDNISNAATAPTLGDARRVSAIYDIPLGSSTGLTLHIQDATTIYDSYGNPVSSTTYAGPGTRLYNGSTTAYSAPGASSAARTTTTTYDSVFHAFPIQVSNPLSQVTRADYNYRMGTLIRVTGPNTTGTPSNCAAASYTIPPTEASSCAQYDVFGRMVKLVKPGDSTTHPTLQASFYDNELPFRYQVELREIAGSTNVRISQQFYDGLGRQIQTKQEGPQSWQNSTIDTRYNGLNQVVATSQARYVTENVTTFYQYTLPPALPAALFNETTSNYDSLGRVRLVTAPGNLKTNTTYTLGSLGTIVTTIDTNNQKTEHESDLFGRLRSVREFSNASSTTAYATTNYSYDGRDLLTRVSDAAGNVISLSYDSLGRKLTTKDPDMGLWSYGYDVNGNLISQRDAKNQTLWFGYDALNRLTQKHQTNASGALLASYSYDAGTYGKGQRTAMSVPGGSSSSWEYDARGRKTKVSHTIPAGSTNYTRVFGWTYDSADRITHLVYPAIGGVTEVVSYAYDTSWRPLSACSNRTGQPCYISGATYTALDQPDQWTLGNSLIQDWLYSSPLQRLAQLKVGNSTPASIFDRSYTYDAIGNIQTIIDNKLSPPQTQSFVYDHRDRLTRAWTTGNTTAGYDESYTYNAIGNLLSKTGVGTYIYPASGPASVRPHTPSVVNGATYSYDANGNLTAGGGRTYTWTLDNLPASIAHASGSETYTYDADGERMRKTRSNVTTLYYEGLWEETAGGAAQIFYTFNGQVVVVRSSSTNAVTYLHSDHLGSVSVATNAAGSVTSRQEFTPWGARRSGDIPHATLDYTGQRLDDTGLLYYHARYYDPVLGRFVSADSIVPGSASGSIKGIAVKPLTVDFHEPGFLATLNGENNEPFWFQLSDEQRQNAARPWGPTNPQALNRYSYVQNNPLRYTDPSGHCSSGIWGVLDLSCLRKAVAIWENTSPGTPEHTLGAAYIGLSAVALVYGVVGAGKLIQGIASGGSLSNQIIKRFLKAKDVQQAITRHKGTDIESLLNLRNAYMKNVEFLSWQIDKLGLTRVTTGHFHDIITATANIRAIEILLKQVKP